MHARTHTTCANNRRSGVLGLAEMLARYVTHSLVVEHVPYPVARHHDETVLLFFVVCMLYVCEEEEGGITIKQSSCVLWRKGASDFDFRTAPHVFRTGVECVVHAECCVHAEEEGGIRLFFPHCPARVSNRVECLARHTSVLTRDALAYTNPY